jgi:hypothetical protein
MRLTTVLGSVDNCPRYYKFIPIQIFFWNKINVKFICVFAGKEIPPELKQYQKNIILWNKNSNLKGAYLGQNLRMYYASLLKLPDDELVMITDMDIFPTNFDYFTKGLENFKIDDFIYYRNIVGNQIYMCYNAAHPKTWSTCFNIKNIKDIENKLIENYPHDYDGVPGKSGWFTDQLIMYNVLHNYPNLKVLNRRVQHLQVNVFRDRLNNGDKNFMNEYTDVHYHRSYDRNEDIIMNGMQQMNEIYK